MQNDPDAGRTGLAEIDDAPILYDNTKLAVARILEAERRLLAKQR